MKGMPGLLVSSLFLFCLFCKCVPLTQQEVLLVCFQRRSWFSWRATGGSLTLCSSVWWDNCGTGLMRGSEWVSEWLFYFAMLLWATHCIGCLLTIWGPSLGTELHNNAYTVTKKATNKHSHSHNCAHKHVLQNCGKSEPAMKEHGSHFQFPYPVTARGEGKLHFSSCRSLK